MANNSLPAIVTGEASPLRRQLRHETLTKKQSSAVDAICLGLFTSMLFFAIVSTIIFFFPTKVLHCNVTFSVESISLSHPSSAAMTWHVDFLVNHPSSRCSVHYDADGVYAKVGLLNAVVLKTSRARRRRSRGYTSFSVDLATVGNETDVPRVFELELKLSARKKLLFAVGDDYGHLVITCQNLILGYEKINKCQSSFEKLKDCC